MTEKSNEQGNAQGKRAEADNSPDPQAEGNQQNDQGSDRNYVSRDEHRRAIVEVVREREHWKQRSKSLGTEMDELKKQMPSADDLTAYQRWVQTHEQAETELAAEREKLQTEHHELIQSHQQELDKGQAAVEAQQRYIEQLLRDNKIITAAERANVANAQAAARLFGPHVKVDRDDDGSYQAVALNEHGQVVRDPDTQRPISVEEGLARYLAREENAFLLKAPAAGGSGMGVALTEQTPLDLSSMQRRLQKARNREEFEAILKAFNRRSG